MAESANGWFVYILKCGDGTFYTGITTDLKRRLEEHNRGKASKYTRTRLPVKMIYRTACRERSEALIRESAIKSLSRAKKKELINGKNK